MKLKRTSSPIEEPITLQDAKDHLHVTTTGEDTAIGYELTDARVFLEKEMNVQMISCGFVGYLDKFPSRNYIEFPIQPMTGVQSVEIFAPDASGYTTLADTNYIFDEFHRPPRLVLAPDASWPSLEDRPNAIKITFNAGYNSASDVPDNWKRALRLVLTNFHEHRGDEGLVTLPKTIFDLIHVDKVMMI